MAQQHTMRRAVFIIASYSMGAGKKGVPIERLWPIGEGKKADMTKALAKIAKLRENEELVKKSKQHGRRT